MPLFTKEATFVEESPDAKAVDVTKVQLPEYWALLVTVTVPLSSSVGPLVVSDAKSTQLLTVVMPDLLVA